MGRTAYELMEEGEFNAVRGKYFSFQSGKDLLILKPDEMTDRKNLWKFIIYTTMKTNNELIRRIETVLESKILIPYIEISESQLPFDPITLRLRK